MTDFLCIQKSKDSFLSGLKADCEVASSLAGDIRAHVITIQRCFRGKVDRDYIKYKSNNATDIQRCFRGLQGRIKAKNEASLRSDMHANSLKKYVVMQIQRCFRGFYSRKYKSNHSDRKKFIGDLEEIGRRVREMMYEYSTAQAVREEREQKAQQEREFEEYASNLHHLVSTNQIRGVFNPPKEYMIQPTWRDIPVEDHVRKTVRDLLKVRGVSKTGLTVDLNGTRKIPLRGLKSRMSLQASAPYEALEKDAHAKLTLHRILTADKEPWVAGGKTDIINNNAQPLNSGDPYVDSNLNPLLKKGVPASEEQLKESGRVQKTLWQPPLARPFYLNASGNKSSTLPNDLFDVIGDAQQSGGVTMRALGTSKRFGVPDSCDNRPPGGVLPEPPLRASIMRHTRPRVNKLTIRTKPAALMETNDGYGLSGVVPYEKRELMDGMEAQEANGESNQLERGSQAEPFDSSDDEA